MIQEINGVFFIAKQTTTRQE